MPQSIPRCFYQLQPNTSDRQCMTYLSKNYTIKEWITPVPSTGSTLVNNPRNQNCRTKLQPTVATTDNVLTVRNNYQVCSLRLAFQICLLNLDCGRQTQNILTMIEPFFLVGYIFQTNCILWLAVPPTHDHVFGWLWIILDNLFGNYAKYLMRHSSRLYPCNDLIMVRETLLQRLRRERLI